MDSCKHRFGSFASSTNLIFFLLCASRKQNTVVERPNSTPTNQSSLNTYYYCSLDGESILDYNQQSSGLRELFFLLNLIINKIIILCIKRWFSTWCIWRITQRSHIKNGVREILVFFYWEAFMSIECSQC